MSSENPDDAIDQALAALPVRMPDVVVAERMRLRAKMELRTGRSSFGGKLGRWWYLAEPFVVSAVVLVVLVWTFDRMAALFG